MSGHKISKGWICGRCQHTIQWDTEAEMKRKMKYVRMHRVICPRMWPWRSVA